MMCYLHLLRWAAIPQAAAAIPRNTPSGRSRYHPVRYLTKTAPLGQPVLKLVHVSFARCLSPRHSGGTS
uniref:Secreted protein n=1 Tax=Ammonifex degensii TaxID=42838 RepID=A0A7C1JNC7_9THEO